MRALCVCGRDARCSPGCGYIAFDSLCADKTDGPCVGGAVVLGGRGVNAHTQTHSQTCAPRERRTRRDAPSDVDK